MRPNNPCRFVAAFLLGATAALISAVPYAAAQTITLTMDDLPFQPIDGLAHPSGVTFGFTVGGVPDIDADFNSSGPGVTAFIDDPSIEGTATGVVSLDFDQPTSILEFGLALSVGEEIPDGVLVSLFDASGELVSTEPLTLTPMPMFAEVQFLHDGAQIKSALIDMTPAQVPARFALDNLTFSPVPEPATALTIATIVLTLSVRRSARTKRQAATHSTSLGEP